MRNEQDSNLWDTGFLMIIAFAMGSIATAIALGRVDQGAPWLIACFQSAVATVLIGVIVGNTYGYLRRWTWRRRRGYPFKEGEIVEVTKGYDAGRCGRVRGHDQGAWRFEIQFEDMNSTRPSRWYPASQLRRQVAEDGLRDSI